MTAKKTELGADIIYNKEFKNSMRGYNPEEVDAFLDIVIKDYEVFESEIKRLTQENERLKSNQTQTRTVPNQNQSNYDVLKRLSNLEKAVFGPRSTER